MSTIAIEKAREFLWIIGGEFELSDWDNSDLFRFSLLEDFVTFFGTGGGGAFLLAGGCGPLECGLNGGGIIGGRVCIWFSITYSSSLPCKCLK